MIRSFGPDEAFGNSQHGERLRRQRDLLDLTAHTIRTLEVIGIDPRYKPNQKGADVENHD